MTLRISDGRSDRVVLIILLERSDDVELQQQWGCIEDVKLMFNCKCGDIDHLP